MAKPPDCGSCQKPATIHLTQIINNQIKKLDFCEDCPHQKGVTDPEGFSLAELLAQGVTPSAEGQQACPGCGLTYSEFKKTGRMGCEKCYEEFKELVVPMLEGMHRGQTHSGKVPERMIVRVTRRREIEGIRRDLADAVEEERYEDAAQFRDKLRQIETEFSSAGKDSADASD